MKRYNPFDFYENNETTIDEQTIYENTGVNYNNVKSKVFESIHTSKRRRLKKSSFIALVAIVAIIASLSTTAYATGKFSDVFGYLFSGECENGLYSGGNVVTECSDDNLNVEVLGISAGSDSEVYVAYQLTKKDGTAFEFSGDITDDSQINFNTVDVEVDFPLGGLFPGGYGASWGANCTMSDEKTIIVYLSYNVSDLSIRGQRMKADFDTLTFERVDEHLGEYIDDFYEEKIEIIEECQPVNGSKDSNEYYEAVNERVCEIEEEYSIEDNQYFEVRRENGKDNICLVTYMYNDEEYNRVFEQKTNELSKQFDLNENQQIDTVYNEELGKEEFCIITYSEYDVTINSELDLNYKENSNEYSIDKETVAKIIDSKYAEAKEGKIVVSPFSVKFDLNFKDKTYFTRGIICDVSASQTESDTTNVIRMNDGTEYYLLWDGKTSEGDRFGNIKETINYTISLTNDEDNPQMIAIDIENIKEVVIGGETISIS